MKFTSPKPLRRATPARPAGRARRRCACGFTLIELMIAVAIVSLLLAVALPSYQDSVRKSRRSEAFNALSAAQQAQERLRSRADAYVTVASTATASGHYNIEVVAPTVSGPMRSGYIAKATAAGSQVADTRCAVIAVQVLGGNMTYGGGATLPTDWNINPDPNRCWAR